MADTTIDLDEMRTKVFEELGSPKKDLPNTSGGIIDDKLTWGARRIQKLASTQGEDVLQDTLATTSGVKNYTIPDNRVVDQVFWGPVGSDVGPENFFSNQFANIPDSSLYGAYPYYWRSDSYMDELALASHLDAHYHWEVWNGEIWVSPTPTGAEVIIYTYWKTDAAVTDLDVMWEEALLYLACSKLCRTLANIYRGHVTPVRGEGFSSYEKTSEWEEKAKEYMDLYTEEAEALVGG